jgi:hypothetical protein
VNRSATYDEALEKRRFPFLGEELRRKMGGTIQ